MLAEMRLLSEDADADVAYTSTRCVRGDCVSMGWEAERLPMLP